MPHNFVDVSTWDSLGPFRVMPPEQLAKPEWENNDYRLTLAHPIWSIGRAQEATSFQYLGQTYAVPKGMVLASVQDYFYQCPGFECIWLR